MAPTYTDILGPLGTNGGIIPFDPNTSSNNLYISGNNVAGSYTETNTGNGFTYGFITSDGVNYTVIKGPAGTNGGIVSINGISGTTIA
jgi:hypothetical protein